MSDSSDYDAIECDHVLTGGVARVLMAKAITKEFFAVESKKQARLLANAKLWADGHRLTDEQFNGNEGRCGGHNDRMLVALKVHKVRLYGFVRSYRGVRTLLIVDLDASKKQNRANPRVLKRAKVTAVRLDAYCDGN